MYEGFILLAVGFKKIDWDFPKKISSQDCSYESSTEEGMNVSLWYFSVWSFAKFSVSLKILVRPKLNFC